MQHTCYSCLAVVLLIVCAELSPGSDGSINTPATPPELKLTIAPTDDSEFIVEGILSEPVPVPRISDFRLERIGDDVRHVPMLFGNERSLAWPDKATCTGLRLTLKPVRSREQDREKLTLVQEANDATVRLYADALLHNEAEYRLTWNCRCGKAVTSRSVRFRYHSPPDANAPAIRTDLPERFYRCEILFRHEGVMFLGQTIVPRLDLQNFTMPAVGFNADGRSVVPTDPGYARIRQQLDELRSKNDNGPVSKPPLAHRTHHFGAQADDHGLTISVSDLGTGLEFPERPGDAAFEMWAGTNPYYPIEAAIFRFELLTGNVERLRQDPEHWKRRTKQIAKEVLAREDWLTESPRRFPIAAYVLADDQLLAQLRRELNDWLDAQPDRLDDHSTARTEKTEADSVAYFRSALPRRSGGPASSRSPCGS